MSKLLKDPNRLLADLWVSGYAGPIELHTHSASREYFFVYSGGILGDGFHLCYLDQVKAAIKGAGWNTRHAQAMAAGLRKHPIHIKALDATSDLSIVTYINKKGRAQHVRMEAGMNTPAVMLNLAYRRHSNRLNHQLKGLGLYQS